MTTARPQLPPEFIAAHKRRRMIEAMAELCAEQGYEATKIADVVRRARVARKTLYDNFSGKEELFLAAFDSAVSEADAAVAEACASIDAAAWEERVEAVLRALLEYADAHPAQARLCLVEAPAASVASSTRYDAEVDAYIARLRGASPSGSGRPTTLAEALVGGTLWIVQRQVRNGGAEDALDLLPELLEFVISPYRGVGKR